MKRERLPKIYYRVKYTQNKSNLTEPSHLNLSCFSLLSGKDMFSKGGANRLIVKRSVADNPFGEDRPLIAD